MDVSSAFRGITTPVREVYDELAQIGWEVSKVSFRDGGYIAEGKNPNGEKLSAKGPDEVTAVGQLLLAAIRRNKLRTGHKLGAWGTTWEDSLPQIAEAYSKAPVYDPKAAPAWKELADDSVRRMQTLQNQIRIEVVDDPEPYANAQEMAEDVHKNQHFYVSRANSDHPMWTVDQNVAFRTVHDILGHVASGGDFGWHGENLACGAHFPLLTESAQKALFTECIGQTAYGAHYRAFGPQKVAFLDEFMDPVQQEENDPNHQGIHPSQSLVPTATPELPASPAVGLPDVGNPAPHQEGLGMTPVFTKTADFTPSDPNANWESAVAPTPTNAYLWQGDPLQAAETRDNASLIDTNWAKAGHLGEMKQAIVNAFRVVLLSPRKDLRWNAIHYQDIAHIPADVSDPSRYWEALAQRRDEWNARRGYAPGSHLPYYKELQDFYRFVKSKNPNLDDGEAREKADADFFHMWNEEEEKILSDPKNSDLTNDEVERKVNKEIAKRLKLVTHPKIKEDFDFGHHQLHLGIQQTLEGEDAGKYGAFMGSHLKAIARISEHVDDLLEAAQEDVQNHDGSGHHFRAVTLALGIPGVGPKVASFAWLLLQPMTSQLATIDTHMMDVLGHDYEKEMNPRDYYKFERELATGRDAAGYNHVPLGQFQWGMWDYKRTGPGTHQDHSAMRVLNPTPYSEVDWASKMGGDYWANAEPSWWTETQPYREQVGQDWDQNVATQFASQRTPHLSKTTVEKIAASTRLPWVYSPQGTYVGNPNETYMQLAKRSLGLSMEEVWQLVPYEQFAIGSYDPTTQEIFSPERLDPNLYRNIETQLKNYLLH